MIASVQNGRLYGVGAEKPLSLLAQREQEAIARLDTRRQEVVRLEAELKRLGEESERFGESQGDPSVYRERLKNARRDFDNARQELHALRAEQQQDRHREPHKLRRASLANNYLEQRLFARDFPEDAHRLKTQQYYDQSGALKVFTFSATEFIGSVVDVRI